MEKFTIYDAQGTTIGIRTRDDVHKIGLWHKVAHIWLLEGDWLYLQQRSYTKKDYPAAYDITVAGHIQPHETDVDGAIRECMEEVGIQLDPSDLYDLGIVKEINLFSVIRDFEIAHIYAYEVKQPVFHLQDEVEAMYKIRIEDVKDLAHPTKTIALYDLQENFVKTITKSMFAPHGTIYFSWLYEKIQEIKKQR